MGVYDWMTASFTGFVLMKIVQDTGIDFLECLLNLSGDGARSFA